MELVKRLSLADLKMKTPARNIVANIEAIKIGGGEDYCHNGYGKVPKNVPDGTYTKPPVHMEA